MIRDYAFSFRFTDFFGVAVDFCKTVLQQKSFLCCQLSTKFASGASLN